MPKRIVAKKRRSPKKTASSYLLPARIKWFLVGFLSILLLLGLASSQVRDRFTSAVLASRIVSVSSSSQLIAALKNAQAGDTIIVGNGTYSSGTYLIVNKKGTSKDPITIKAATPRKAILSDKGYFYIMNSSYVTIEGFEFSNSTPEAVKIMKSDHAHITRNVFHLKESGGTSNWIYISGSTEGNHTIDRNLFENKKSLGRFILIAGDTVEGASRNNIIAYNHFRNIGPYEGNGKEAITLGSSSLSNSVGGNRVEYNLFEDCTGDREVISLKTNKNVIRFNTFRNNEGSVTARQGDNAQIYGNFFLGGKGGVRVFGKNHLIFNNYFENTTGTGTLATLVISNGDVESLPTSTSNAFYSRPENITVAFNTFVNNAASMEIGSTATGTLVPRGLMVANNIIKASQGKLVNIFTQPLSSTWSGNITYPSNTVTFGFAMSSSEVRALDPRLTVVNGLQKLSKDSPAVNSAIGSNAPNTTFWFLNKDMDGNDREGSLDVGADEVSSQPITRKPLTASMVGPNSQ